MADNLGNAAIAMHAEPPAAVTVRVETGMPGLPHGAVLQLPAGPRTAVLLAAGRLTAVTAGEPEQPEVLPVPELDDEDEVEAEAEAEAEQLDDENDEEPVAAAPAQAVRPRL